MVDPDVNERSPDADVVIVRGRPFHGTVSAYMSERGNIVRLGHCFADRHNGPEVSSRYLIVQQEDPVLELCWRAGSLNHIPVYLVISNEETRTPRLGNPLKQYFYT